MRIDLNCPFAEKDAAKSLGARWDVARRTWYIENMEDLTPFMRWITTKVDAKPTITLRDYLARHYKDTAPALTHSAANAFGVPYPLPKGWVKTYGHKTILVTAMEAIKRKVGKRHASRAESPKESPTRTHSSCKAGTSRVDARAWGRTGPDTLPTCACATPPWEACAHSFQLNNAFSKDQPCGKT